MSLRLPEGYVDRDAPSRFLDVPRGVVYQPLVYELLGFLARRSGACRVIDIGCGAASKLRPLARDFELICVEAADGLALARANVPGATFLEYDLERGVPEIADDVLRDAVVVCADVVEHLRDPRPLVTGLARIARHAPFLLISTPDRDRARGLFDLGPPANTAHVREWSAGEFCRFLHDCGFSTDVLAGHTVNTDVQGARTTTLIVAGRHAERPGSVRPARIAAIVNAYNERDVLPEVVAHLHAQGVETHLVDNWSNDGTFELGCALRDQGLCRAVVRFPDAPKDECLWEHQLQHTEEYGARLEADWVMHHDADEIRCAPWRGVTLADAFAHVDALGYNAIDFSLLNFRFLRDCPDPVQPFEASMTWFEFGRRTGHFVQIKAWKNAGRPVSLAPSGGHEAVFEGRRVFPLKFLMKHYPLRTRAQATRKIFHERLPRFAPERRDRAWHTQYDGFNDPGDVCGWEPSRLLPWHERHFDSEYLVERLSGIGLIDRRG